MFTYLPTCFHSIPLLTNLPTYLLACLFTYSLTYFLTHLLTYPHTCALTHELATRHQLYSLSYYNVVCLSAIMITLVTITAQAAGGRRSVTNGNVASINSMTSVACLV